MVTLEVLNLTFFYFLCKKDYILFGNKRKYCNFATD